jgi:hypothetical protein
MEEDGLEDSLSAAIVEVWGSGAQTPEGGGTHFAGLSVGLSDTVGQLAHSMEEQIGVKINGFKGEGGTDRAGAGPHGRFVTGNAVDLGE